MPHLYQPHEPAFTALMADILSATRWPGRVFLGSPGSVTVRTKSGSSYYYRQYYRPDGGRADEYLGPVGSTRGEAAREAVEADIAATARLARNARSLAREGFAVVDKQTARTLAALAHHDLFRAGLLLVGTHAFGSLANGLGIRVSAVRTEDVDVARFGPLQLSAPLEGGWQRVLLDSGLPFVPVPGLEPAAPPTSYKLPGPHRLRLNLLTPSADDEVTIAAVPELATHGQALPYLAYLIAETQHGVVLGPGHVIPVRLPVAERLALHKLLSSQLRRGRDAKADKDLRQAATLIAALAERDDGGLEDARAHLPASARGRVRAAARRAVELFVDRDGPAAGFLRGL